MNKRGVILVTMRSRGLRIYTRSQTRNAKTRVSSNRNNNGILLHLAGLLAGSAIFITRPPGGDRSGSRSGIRRGRKSRSRDPWGG